MREELTFQRADPASLTISSLTQSGGTATATTTSHGYVAGDYVRIAGATPSGFNGKVKILSVPTITTFTYAVSSGLSSPASGPMIVTYVSNAQGGAGAQAWRDIDTVFAEMVPLSATERLQLAAIQSDTRYRFRIRVRSDLGPSMRALWTPAWPPDATQKVLQITGLLPIADGTAFQFVEAAEVPA